MRLPTFDLSDEVYERVIAAYGGEDEYRAWLSREVMNRALNYETQAVNTILRERVAEVWEALEEVRDKNPLADRLVPGQDPGAGGPPSAEADLPGIVPDPPTVDPESFDPDNPSPVDPES